MLLEYCNGGDLLTYQSSLKGKIFTVDAAVDVLSDVIRGMVHMHEHGYLHRDLKLENILVCNNKDGSKTFKIADFGFSKPQNQMRATNVGTDLYKAPEVYLEEEHGYWVDMWSFGILFYHMLNLAYPFKPHPFLTQVKKGQ